MNSQARTTAEKLALFRKHFMGLTEVYGTYDPATGRAYQVKEPVTDQVLLAHLKGQQPYGVYLLVGETTRAVAADFDNDCPDSPRAFVTEARRRGIPAHIERSRSKGYHAWTFMGDVGVPASKARGAVRAILTAIGQNGVEVFPKQDRLGGGAHFGNYINAPLFGRLVPQGRTVFVDPDSMAPYPDQWAVLESVEPVSEAQLDQVIGCGAVGLGVNSSSPIPQAPPPVPAAPSRFALPPCARRMLQEGVEEHQRVACFRLAVHMSRLGFPCDIAVPALCAWAKKNRPRGGKEVISDAEVEEQVTSAYRKGYRGFGCQEAAVAPYCSPECWLTPRAQATGNGAAPAMGCDHG